MTRLPAEYRQMSPEQYSWTIRQLGMNKSQAARFLGVSLRTGQRATGTALRQSQWRRRWLLRLMLAHSIRPQSATLGGP